MWWPLTLTYIFKVIWPWPRKSCPLCSVYSCGWILSIFSTNDHYRYRVCRMLRFFPESGNLNFWQFFLNFLPLTLKKSVQFWMDSFHIWYKWSLPWEGVLHVMTFDLDLYLQGHLTLTLSWIWPWLRVRSATFSVRDWLFPYLPQIITTIRGYVTC